jgi:hypothetical protein
MPWWDFWVPIIAEKSLLKLYHVKNNIIKHRTHKTNYDHDSWVKFGGYLYQDIVIKLMKKEGNPNLPINDFCTITKNHIESKHINIKIK